MKKEVLAKKSKAYWHRYKWLYIFLIPGLIYFIVINYVPMYGIGIAFQDFNPVAGMTGSKFVGWQNFKLLFQSDNFMMVF